jgi:hypothetical protein
MQFFDRLENDRSENDPLEDVRQENSFTPLIPPLCLSGDRDPRASLAPADCGREAR